MKSELFLALPVAATVFNIFFALQLNHAHSKVDAQPVVVNEAYIDRCLDNSLDERYLSLDDYRKKDDAEELAEDKDDDAQPSVVVNEAYIDRCLDNSLDERYLSLDDYRKDDAEDLAEDKDDLVDPEKDPMLKPMPETDFEAYELSDSIATFYGQEPGSSMKERKPSFKGQAGKFINMSPDRISLYWDGPSKPEFNANLSPWESGGTACYPSHKFIILTKPHRPDDVICRFQGNNFSVVLLWSLFRREPNTRPSGVVMPSKLRSLDELSHHELNEYAAPHVYNLEIGELYKKITGSSEWLSIILLVPGGRPLAWMMSSAQSIS
jgi:hypothetical protein